MTMYKYLLMPLYQTPKSVICQSAIGGVWLYTVAVDLTLFQLGRDNFYHHDSTSRDKA